MNKDYNEMSKEELVKALQKSDEADVYISKNNSDVICVKPKGRSFPVSANKDCWRSIVASIERIKELL